MTYNFSIKGEIQINKMHSNPIIINSLSDFNQYTVLRSSMKYHKDHLENTIKEMHKLTVRS